MYCLTRKVTVVYVEFWTSVCERDVDKLLATVHIAYGIY